MATQCDLSGMSPAELLGLYRTILAALKERGVIRANNAPTGDYAEFLVREATRGTLAPQSQKSWDLQLPDGGPKWQVKSRVISEPEASGERQLSRFNSWEFDQGMIVLFDEGFRVRRAALLPSAVLEEAASDRGVVIARNELLDVGECWTDRLNAAAP